MGAVNTWYVCNYNDDERYYLCEMKFNLIGDRWHYSRIWSINTTNALDFSCFSSAQAFVNKTLNDEEGSIEVWPPRITDWVI